VFDGNLLSRRTVDVVLKVCANGLRLCWKGYRVFCTQTGRKRRYTFVLTVEGRQAKKNERWPNSGNMKDDRRKKKVKR